MAPVIDTMHNDWYLGKVTAVIYLLLDCRAGHKTAHGKSRRISHYSSTVASLEMAGVILFRTAVPFWGQTT